MNKLFIIILLAISISVSFGIGLTANKGKAEEEPLSCEDRLEEAESLAIKYHELLKEALHKCEAIVKGWEWCKGELDSKSRRR
jgi:hypothetical protein